MKWLSPEEITWARECVAAGDTLEDLAEMAEVAPAELAPALAAAGIQPRAVPTELLIGRDHLIADAWEEGLPTRVIAEMARVSRRRIQQIVCELIDAGYLVARERYVPNPECIQAAAEGYRQKYLRGELRQHADRDEQILALVGTGPSNSEIGARFGLTRSAVCGIAYRERQRRKALNKSEGSMAFNWTEDHVEQLTQRYGADGDSAATIARDFGGGCTRNAVIGKALRLGLTNAARPRRERPAKGPKDPAPGPRGVSLTQLKKRVEANAVAASTYVEPPPEGPGLATVVSLQARMCRWPIGDPLMPEFTLCGQLAPDGKAYCAGHARVAYQPLKANQAKTGNQLARQLRRYL